LSKKDKITVQGTEITLFAKAKQNYISLTDMAKHKNAEATGLVISHWLPVIPSDLWVFGNKCSTPILMLRNTVTLKMKVATTVLFFLQNNGLSERMPLELFPNRDVMAEALLPIPTLHLSLPLG
jgi:hypothetical protein